jgi:hypothetical protein
LKNYQRGLADLYRSAERRDALHMPFDWPDEACAEKVHTFWLGPEDAQNVLIVISGTHGSELKAGALLQRKLVQLDYLNDILGPHTALLIIFALNVDACINERRMGIRHPSEANRGNGPEFITKPLSPKVLRSRIYQKYLYYRIPRLLSVVEFDELVKLCDNPLFAELMMRGQHDDREAFAWGGDYLCFAGEVAIKICKALVRHRRKVAVIDAHTGLYKFGALLSTAETNKKANFVRQWLPDAKFINLEKTRSQPMQGTMIQLFERQLSQLGAQVLAVGLEMQARHAQPLPYLLGQMYVDRYRNRMDPGLVERIEDGHAYSFYDRRLFEHMFVAFGTLTFGRMLAFLHAP